MRSPFLTLLAFALVACDPSALPWATSGTIDVDDARASYPPADVQLPPVPNLELIDVPPTYDDGSYSVQGLILNRTEAMDQMIRVTGILQEVYECEVGTIGVEGEAGELAVPVEPEDDFAVRPGCLRPHLYLVDHLRARQRLLVTGYEHEVYEPQIRPGMRYTAVGMYAQQTRGFISTEDGLLVASAIDGDGIVVPPPEGTEESAP